MMLFYHLKHTITFVLLCKQYKHINNIKHVLLCVCAVLIKQIKSSIH